MAAKQGTTQTVLRQKYSTAKTDSLDSFKRVEKQSEGVIDHLSIENSLG